MIFVRPVWIVVFAASLAMQQNGVHAQTPSGPLSGQSSPSTQSVAAPSPGISASSPFHLIVPAIQPVISPGALTLLELETRFAQAVAEGGGKAFASWFADDAVTLNNGVPAVLGRGAIAQQATWDPHVYVLTWLAQGAQMGPSNDMGFTWGHYESRGPGAKGEPVVTSGRYITIWRKLADGSWKVAMDASADESPSPTACCNLLKP